MASLPGRRARDGPRPSRGSTISERLQLDRTAIEWRHVEGEVVALDLRDSMYLGINPSGAVLWPLLAEGTTRDALIDALAAHFELEREHATRDVDTFLEMLRGRELLVDDSSAA